MQKAFEKIVERLEEKALETLGIDKQRFQIDKNEYSSYCSLSLYEVKEVINQVAEEYKQEVSICNNSFYKDMPQDFQDAVKVIMGYCQHEDCAYSCDDCSNCPNPLSVIRCGDTLRNDGWIPCSEQPYPTTTGYYLVTIDGFNRPMYAWWKWTEKKWEYLNSQKEIEDVIAWQPLPPAFQPKGE